jgi:drug/metabolite transporter (DMT)-like permease
MNTFKSLFKKVIGGSELVNYIAVLVASAFWGTSGIFVKFFSTETQISALALAFWRDVSTAILLLIIIGLLRPSWLRVQLVDIGWLATMGGILGIFHVFWNLGVVFNGVQVATVQQAAMPAIVALVAWLIWRELITSSKILAIILAFIGTVLVSGLNIMNQEINLSGLFIGFSIPILYAGWTLSTKKVREKYNPFTTLTFAFIFASLVLLPFQLFTSQPQIIPSIAWIWFLGLILVSTIAGFSIYVFALGRLQVSIASILAMSEIVFVAIYAFILLDEQLSASQILGAVLVMGSVLFLSWHGLQTNIKEKIYVEDTKT